MNINFTMDQLNSFIDEVNEIVSDYGIPPDQMHTVLKTQQAMIRYMNQSMSSFSPD